MQYFSPNFSGQESSDASVDKLKQLSEDPTESNNNNENGEEEKDKVEDLKEQGGENVKYIFIAIFIIIPALGLSSSNIGFFKLKK